MPANEEQDTIHPQARIGRPAGRAARVMEDVVVTGLGVVAPSGVGTDAFWAGLQHGQSVVGPQHVLDEHLDLGRYFDAKELRRSDRVVHLATVAVQEALSSAGLADTAGLDLTRCGIIVGTGVGGWGSSEAAIRGATLGGHRKLGPMTIPMIMSNATGANLAIRHGFAGPCETIMTACASGSNAIGYASRLIAAGECDVVIAGGADAPLVEFMIAAFKNMTALSTTGWSRPFDTRRDGFVIAEGAAFVILESASHAKRRNATVRAQLLGTGSTTDATHLVKPDGVGALQAMRVALRNSGLEPGDVAHINCHGTSTPLNDPMEANAIMQLFPDGAPPVTSFKGSHGHALGAAGAIEAVGVILSMEHALIPPTGGLDTIDPAITLDVVVGEARPWIPGPTLSNSFAFGGHNGVLCLAPGHQDSQAGTGA